MMIQNKHIHEQLLKNKSKVVISEDQPLVILISNQSSFLRYFCETIIRYFKINITTKYEDAKVLMDYTLPIICFQDYVLQKQNLVQFLSDLALSKLELVQYVQRKQNVKKMYRIWSHIFNYQEHSLWEKGQLQELTKIELSNKIFEELLSFSINILNRNYNNIYEGYNRSQFRIEVVMMIDIVDTIIKDYPKYKSDYVLRGYFEKIINFSENTKKKYQNLEGEELLQFSILIDKKQKDNSIKALLNTNLRWFFSMMIGLSFVFGKWAK